ncbi:MAG: hypothetical protein OEX77_00160 [Candidatus Bathyarchaeota archaeon]|nr:hypothetical protein [Candidatus Bathyarchaeota archaeon]MDH5732225.1 hypothetical protein [Candidatus Bathyarchaeota archaeon]
MVVVGITILCTYYITSAATGEGKNYLLTITLDKDVYQQGERMYITIKNVSNETLHFTNSNYGLEYQFWNGFSWTFFIGMPGRMVVVELKPGEIGYVQHSLVGSWYLEVGKWRVGDSYYDCWTEFFVILD